MKEAQLNKPQEIEQALETYEKSYAEIIRNLGKYVLIKGNSIVEYFASYRDAVRAGYERFGITDFLVKRVQQEDEPISVMRCGIIKTDGRLRISKPANA